MNSVAKFNKHISELHINIINEFADKLKIQIPIEFHQLIDHQSTEDIDKVKLAFKNIQKKSKSDKPKKPKKTTAYNAFTTHRLKELKGNKPPEGETNMGICGKEWNTIKANGQTDFWQQKADQENEQNEQNEQQLSQQSDQELSELSDQEQQDKPKNKTKKPKAQTKPKAQKKTKAQKKKTAQQSDSEDSDQEIHTEDLPELSMSD